MCSTERSLLPLFFDYLAYVDADLESLDPEFFFYFFLFFQITLIVKKRPISFKLFYKNDNKQQQRKPNFLWNTLFSASLAKIFVNLVYIFCIFHTIFNLHAFYLLPLNKI